MLPQYPPSKETTLVHIGSIQQCADVLNVSTLN